MFLIWSILFVFWTVWVDKRHEHFANCTASKNNTDTAYETVKPIIEYEYANEQDGNPNEYNCENDINNNDTCQGNNQNSSNQNSSNQNSSNQNSSNHTGKNEKKKKMRKRRGTVDNSNKEQIYKTIEGENNTNGADNNNKQNLDNIHYLMKEYPEHIGDLDKMSGECCKKRFG